MPSNVLPKLPAEFNGKDLYEIRIGIYATVAEITQDIIQGCAQVLTNGAEFNIPQVPWDLTFFGEDKEVFPKSGNSVTIAEFYIEQEDSWKERYLGEVPGGRTLNELRVGLFCTEKQAYEIQAALLNFLSPADAMGIPLLDYEYQWSTWVLSPFHAVGKYDEYAKNHLHNTHENLANAPQ
ncbi:MAG: hypothetical protein QM571_00595 [Micrococcaceae bacterium]